MEMDMAVAMAMAFKGCPMWQRHPVVVLFPQIKRYHLQRNNFPNRKKLACQGGEQRKHDTPMRFLFAENSTGVGDFGFIFFVHRVDSKLN